MDYLDFELEIGSGSERDYTVTVVRSPAGEARVSMRLPFGELEIKAYLKDLKIALLRPAEQRRGVRTHEEEQAVQQFGQALFEALLSGEARSCYDVSRREAARQGRGLRLKLRIQPPELAALPWEFLYDSRQGEYICLSRSTPIVRYLELSQEIQPLAVAPPLRILGMIASPQGLPELNVVREKLRMEEAIEHLSTRGLVELVWLEGQTWRDLQRAMQLGPWHVFHFLGHGSFDHDASEGWIALANEDGEPHRLFASGLGRLLADHFPLRLVLLNACEGARGSERDVFSSSAATLVRRGIPAVLAMQHEISDEAAVEFARAFYEALANDLPVDGAITEARKAMSLASVNSMEWGVPVLYTHAPDGVLFNIQRSTVETTPSHGPARSPHTVHDLPTQAPVSNQRRRSTALLVAVLPVLAAVIGFLIILSSPFGRAASTGMPTAPGEGSGVPTIVIASPTANDTPEPSQTTAAISESTLEPAVMRDTTLDTLPPGFAKLEKTVFGRWDPNVPSDVRLELGRFYHLTGHYQGRYCEIQLIQPNAVVWVLCTDVQTPVPSSQALPPKATPKPTPTSASALTSVPAAAPAPSPPVASTIPPLAPTVAALVTYRVDIVKISREQMMTLAGCETISLSPDLGILNNTCIFGPAGVNIKIENLKNGYVTPPIPSDARQLYIVVDYPARVTVVSDRSGLPVTTIGSREFTPERDQFYEISLTKIE